MYIYHRSIDYKAKQIPEFPVTCRTKLGSVGIVLFEYFHVDVAILRHKAYVQPYIMLSLIILGSRSQKCIMTKNKT